MTITPAQRVRELAADYEPSKTAWMLSDEEVNKLIAQHKDADGKVNLIDIAMLYCQAAHTKRVPQQAEAGPRYKAQLSYLRSLLYTDAYRAEVVDYDGSIDVNLGVGGGSLPDGTDGDVLKHNGSSWVAGKVDRPNIEDEAIVTDMIEDEAITRDKLATSAVGEDEIGARSIIPAHLNVRQQTIEWLTALGIEAVN